MSTHVSIQVVPLMSAAGGAVALLQAAVLHRVKLGEHLLVSFVLFFDQCIFLNVACYSAYH